MLTSRQDRMSLAIPPIGQPSFEPRAGRDFLIRK
jgi:hypothetical protein